MHSTAYLSGEIHSDRRRRIIDGAAAEPPEQVVEILQYVTPGG